MIDTTINRGLVRSGAVTSYKNYRQHLKPPATVREREIIIIGSTPALCKLSGPYNNAYSSVFVPASWKR